MILLEKWHSIGNDFLISKTELSMSEIARLCDRNFGIGADQFILLNGNNMRFFNQDGSEAEMCGNALKCVIKMLAQETGEVKFLLETKKGLINCEFQEGYSMINLGKPLSFKQLDEGFFVNLGNPHLVIFLELQEEEFWQTDFVQRKGLEMQIKFAETKGVNVSFVLVKDETTLFVRTFERGVGETLSCGSGSCASFFTSFKNGLSKGKMKIFNKGSKKVLAFNESYHLLYFENEDLILKGIGTKVARIEYY